MTNQDAIKYLQQLYPNGGHCWLDEQRIEAISMAIKALQEELVSEDLEEEYHEFLKREWFGKPGKTISEQMFFTAQYFAQWERDRIIDKLQREVLPCFMDMGDVDSVLEKLIESLKRTKYETLFR